MDDGTKIVHLWADRVFNDYDEIIGQVGACRESGDIETTDWPQHVNCPGCIHTMKDERR